MTKRVLTSTRSGIRLHEIVDDTQERMAPAEVRSLLLGLDTPWRRRSSCLHQPVPYILSIEMDIPDYEVKEGYVEMLKRAMNVFSIDEMEQMRVELTHGEMVANALKYTGRACYAQSWILNEPRFRLFTTVHVPGHHWKPKAAINPAYLNQDQVVRMDSHGRGHHYTSNLTSLFAYSRSGDTVAIAHDFKEVRGLERLGRLAREMPKSA